MNPFSDVVVLGSVSEVTMGGHNAATDPGNTSTALGTQR
jgi:hypothetical protein